MNKKHITRILILGLVLTAAACSSNKSEENKNVYHVDFFNNYLRQDFMFPNDYIARGNNIIYKTVDVEPNSLITKPEDPSRRFYDFKGWYKEDKLVNLWDFENDLVKENTRLYAKWEISENDKITEPSYTPPSTVLEASAGTDYVINSVMNFKIEGSSVGLSRAAIAKLNANSGNVLPFIEYKVKAGKNITATYDDSKITINVDGNSPLVINVVNNTSAYEITVEDNKDNYQTYESKAKKYEDNYATEDNYHVMLAGSSSIEFWDTYKEDMDPIVSFNHGIGGTTIEQWTNKLNQRLVYPYKPKMAVYYVGINNVINSKQSASKVSTLLETFLNQTHADLPDTQVQYILLNQLPGYPSYKSTIETINNYVIEYQKSNTSWLTLINPGVYLMKETKTGSQPDASYFRLDGLHLSYFGYTIWGGKIKESILTGLEAME